MKLLQSLFRLFSADSEAASTLRPMNIHSVNDDQSLDSAFEHSMKEPVVLFKHSSTCPISAMARNQITSLHDPEDPPVYEVVVQRSRPISHKIEAELGIKHESPQVIILHQKEPVFHTSHSRITAELIRQTVLANQ